MKYILFSLFAILIVGSPITASAFLDFFDPIKRIQDILETQGEEAAISAINVLVKFSGEEYVLNILDNISFNSDHVLVYHLFLTVIYELNENKYSSILNSIPQLRDYEIKKNTEEANKVLEEFNEKYGNTFDEYGEESWKIVKESTEKQIRASVFSEDNVSELEKRRGLKDEITITAIEIIPTVDPETKKVLPLKLVAVKYADRVYFMRGSDFSNDPTRTTALLILEPSFFLDVKSIQTADGKWISIEEASEYGYKDVEIQKIMDIIEKTKGLSDVDDPTKIIENYYEILDLIELINDEKEFLTS